jgi:hypothetical protein
MTRTTQNLIDDVRARADMPDPDGFVTNTQIIAWLNLAIAELRELWIGEFGEDYDTTVSTNQVTVANTDQYALGATFFKLVGIDVSFDGGSTWHTCERFNFAERNRGQDSPHGWSRNSLPRYKLVGSNVMFRPTPAGVFTWRYWYIPTFTRLSGLSDVFDFHHGWEDWVACRVAIRCLQKEQSDSSALERDLPLIQQRIFNAAKHRDAGAPERVADVRGLLRRDDEEWM